MEKTILRQLKATDIADVTKLELLCNPLPWNSDALSRFAAEAVPSGAHSMGIVAVSESEKAIGYLCAAAVEEDAEVLVLGVDPKHRRQGIGLALLGEMRQTLKALGCKSLFLEVRSRNESAISLYRRAGFTEAGVRRGYYADTGEDALVLRWDLSR